jgi:hypothetical protein
MYQVFRNMTVEMSRQQEAIEMITSARDRLNGEHGGHYGVSIAVGGDPTAVTLSSPFETLGQYEAMRMAVMQDAELQSIIRNSGGIITSAQDTIAQIIKPPGPRSTFAGVNVAMMHLPAVADSVAFAVEVANYVDQQTGNTTAVLTAMTGNRAGLMWVGFSDSLDDLAGNAQKLETDPHYIEFFARSEKLFVPGTLEQSIWQMLP